MCACLCIKGHHKLQQSVKGIALKVVGKEFLEGYKFNP